MRGGFLKLRDVFGLFAGVLIGCAVIVSGKGGRGREYLDLTEKYKQEREEGRGGRGWLKRSPI